MWLLILSNKNEKMRDAIIIMQKQRALITCKNNLFKHLTTAFDQNNSFLSVKFKPFNNRFRLKQQVSQCNVQSTAKRFKELSASVCIRITLDEVQSPFARFNNRWAWGHAVEVECDSAVSERIHQIRRLWAHLVWNYCTWSRRTGCTTGHWHGFCCAISFGDGPRKLSLFVLVCFIVVI